METPYRAVSFVKHDIITRDKMQQLQSDLQWINDNTPRGIIYRSGNAPKTTLVVIISGKKQIKTNKKSSTAKATVKFGRAFDPGCKPNVTTGINCDFQRNLFCVVTGPSDAKLPTSTGFEIRVAAQDDPNTKKTEVIKKDFWVHWSAVGYRVDDMHDF